MAGRSNGQVNLEPSVDDETYNKVHHDLDVAAAKRKPIVTDSKYKVKVAEPGVETLHLEDHDHHEDHADHGRKSEKTVTNRSYEVHSSTKEASKATSGPSKPQTQEKPKPKSTGESLKGQFIAKPDVYSDKNRGEPKKEDKEGGFAWFPVLGGALAIAGAIAGAMYFKKKNPDADQRVRRLIEDSDHRVKGFIGNSENRVKEIIGSGQQKFNDLVHRGDHSDDDSHSHNTSTSGLNLLDGGSYKVKQGDTLTKIAKKSGKKSWHEIAEKNPSLRNPNLIYPGDRLKL